MGVVLHNKKKNDDLTNITDELEMILLSNEERDYEKEQLFYLILEKVYKRYFLSDRHSLFPMRYSEWNYFLKKYIWSFCDKKGISTLEFNGDDRSTIGSEEMGLLIEYLESIDVNGERENEIKSFLLKQKEGIYYS